MTNPHSLEKNTSNPFIGDDYHIFVSQEEFIEYEKKIQHRKKIIITIAISAIVFIGLILVSILPTFMKANLELHASPHEKITTEHEEEHKIETPIPFFEVKATYQ